MDGDLKEAADECLLQCGVCSEYSHSYCLPAPMKKFLDWAERYADKMQYQFTCYKCIKCAGCNGQANVWTRPMNVWNMRRVAEDAPDEVIPTCGDCLWRFKHEKEFCPVCYKLYPPEEPPLEQQVPLLPPGQSLALA